MLVSCKYNMETSNHDLALLSGLSYSSCASYAVKAPLLRNVVALVHMLRGINENTTKRNLSLTVIAYYHAAMNQLI